MWRGRKNKTFPKLVFRLRIHRSPAEYFSIIQFGGLWFSAMVRVVVRVSVRVRVIVRALVRGS